MAFAEGGGTRVGRSRGDWGRGEESAEGTLRGEKGKALSTGDPRGRETPTDGTRGGGAAEGPS